MKLMSKVRVALHIQPFLVTTVVPNPLIPPILVQVKLNVKDLK